jgi:isopentenyl-diphosphate delta-isomerase
MTAIGERKADHLAICAEEDVGFRRASTLLECVRLVHDALPDLELEDVDTSVTLFGKRLRVPIVIAAMTGGTDEAGRINAELASIAEAKGLAFGLGSQRAMVVHPTKASTYDVRQVAPTCLVFGNVGLVQARAMSAADLRRMIEQIGADALCVHMNPAMELVQPGGDRDFTAGLDTLRRLVAELGVPIIAKETGCGLSPDVGRRLRSIGVEHVDVSGAGGTSWVGVETRRATAAGDVAARALGEALWDWGIPTAASVALLRPLGFHTVVATGGIASGLDVARSLALGATVAGIARPVLRALRSGGRAGAIAFLEGIEAELRAVMLLTASPDLSALRAAPRVLTGELVAWLTQLSEPDPRRR